MGWRDSWVQSEVGSLVLRALRFKWKTLIPESKDD